MRRQLPQFPLLLLLLLLPLLAACADSAPPAGLPAGGSDAAGPQDLALDGGGAPQADLGRPGEDAGPGDAGEAPDDGIRGDGGRAADGGEVVEPTDAGLADCGAPVGDAGGAAGDAGGGDAAAPDGGAADDGWPGDAGPRGGEDGAVLPDGGVAGDGGPAAGGPRPGCIQGEFQPFRGDLHAHTSYSDGKETPADAFGYARDVAGLDIMAVTDHLEQLWLYGVGNAHWDACRDAADEANQDGHFVAICGFEYGTGFQWFQSTGHDNVYFSDDLFPMIQLDFHEFYRSVAGCPDCIAQFNHPGDDAGQNWNDFEYFPDVDTRMNLFEFNGSGPVWEMYFQALDAGWHVSPADNQDNHDADWGTHNADRTGFFLSELSRPALHDAMRNRRSFMTHDADASLRLLGDSVCWMGSILEGPGDLQLDVEARDAEEGDGFATIELFGPGSSLLATIDCAGQPLCRGAYLLPVAGPTYVVARATQQDGDQLVSAPIWVRF